MLPELERRALPLREDVGLHRLETRIVVGERLPAGRVLDAPVDHVAEERDASELHLELRERLGVGVRGVGVADVAGDTDRAAEGLRVVEDVVTFLDELLGLGLPDALVARCEGAVGMAFLDRPLRAGREAARAADRGAARRRLAPRRDSFLGALGCRRCALRAAPGRKRLGQAR